MKYSDLVTPLLVDKHAAGIILGKESVFDAALQAGWIKPLINKNACKLYKRQDVEAIIDKIERLGYPDNI